MKGARVVVDPEALGGAARALDEAMTFEFRNEPANTTDATMGQGLRTRVGLRKQELEAAITNPATDARTRIDLEHALGNLQGLLTGDLDHIPKVVAAELNTWLEANKHLDEHQPPVSDSIATSDG